MEDIFEGFGGFVLPPDAGITPLDFMRDHGLCTECEARPAMFVVAPPGQPERRLCGECLFREFAPKQPSRSEMLEQEAARIAEAERTASPEQIGHMVEFLDEWWASQPPPTPAFVSDFLARHRVSLRPPAVPTIGDLVASGDYHAAELALLVMRAKLAEKQTIDEHRYVIEPDPTPISREEAADRLARIAKPLRCRGTAPNGMMTVRCRTMSDPAELAGRTRFVESTMEGGVYFRNLQQEWGDRYPGLQIFCAGWRESLVVSAAEVDRYHRDYDVHPMGTNSSPPSFYLATNPDVARAAVAAGAVYVMKCHFRGSDWASEKEGRVIDVRDGETWDFPQVFALTAELAAPCAECGLRPATWRATDTRATPWQERLLCAQCTATALAPRAVADGEQYIAAVTALSEKGRRSAARDLAAQVESMERWWKHLPMPAEVAAVLARCRTV